LPIPLLADVIASQFALLVAAHAQCSSVVMVKLPLPPEAG
jgi:hypothetical protein